MKKRLICLAVLTLVAFALPVLAQALPFGDDYPAINRAAGSVLMLWVYDSEQSDFIATGSGFVAFDDATLVTNYHVIEGGDYILAESDEGRSYFLDRVLIADKARDLAVLRFKSPTRLPPLLMDGQDERLRGQPVVAIGSPEGYRNTVSKGDLSALFREDGVRYLQFTAPISHGSSGGPLFDSRGRVIGVTTASLMGDSQNLNFAVDAAEVLELYAQAGNGEGLPLSSLDSQSGKRPEEAPLATPAPEEASSVRGLSVTQTGADTVELTWQSSLPEGQRYWVGYEIEGNSYYSFLESSETRVEITDLVPGEAYYFYLAMSEEGLAEPLLRSLPLRLRAAAPYRERGAELVSIGFYLTARDRELVVPLPPKTERVTEGELAKAGTESRLSAVYRLRLQPAPDESRGSCLYVLRTPAGTVYSSAYHYNYGAEGGAALRRADLQDILDEIIQMEERYPVGAYTLSVYHDGALLGEAGLTIGAEEAAANGVLLPAPTGLAVKTGEGVVLTWEAVPGAEEYRVYRAGGEDGHFFFLGAASGPAFTDAMAVSGRTYRYAVESVAGGSPSLRSEALTVTLPPRGQPEPPAERPVSWPLDFGEQAYVGTRDNPYIDPDVVNLSPDRVVTGLTLSYYCEDAGNRPLAFGDSGRDVTAFSFEVRVEPGQLVNPGKVSLKRYGPDVRYIYVAISQIRLEDGEVIDIPLEKQEYFYWTLDE